MHSHLTRSVFRRLASNRPILPRRHLHKYARPRNIRQHGRVLVPRPQTRAFGFFSLFQKPTRDVRQPLLDPGMDKMLELDKRINLTARLPPPEELTAAFKEYIQSRDDRNMVIFDYHAFHLLQTLRTILACEAEQNVELVSHEDLKKAQNVLSRDCEKTEIHVELEDTLLDAIVKKTNHILRRVIVKRHVKILCGAGKAKEARDYLENWCSQRQNQVEEEQESKTPPFDVWLPILQAFISERSTDEFWNTINVMKQLSVDTSSSVIRRYETLLYLKTDNTEKSKGVFQPDIFLTNPRASENEELTQEILSFSLRNNQMQWALDILRQAATAHPKAVSLDLGGAALQAAAAAGKSVEDIDHMLGVLLQSAHEGNIEEFTPDATLFNNLLKFAVERKDPYAAERFLRLLPKWKIEPNAETFVLQIEYRLNANDISGAKAAYEELRDFEVKQDEDWGALNKLVQSLCNAPDADNEFLLRVVGDMSGRRKLFQSETVQALCRYHLERDEYYDMVDLLQTYAPQFPNSQRLEIRDILVNYALDPEADTGRAWDTYMIFHQVFDAETTREIRNEVMSFFFERQRPDLATHVFTRMARHVRQDHQPDRMTYILALEGIAYNNEASSLEVVHNLLKLDTNVEPNTQLLNALMIAYDACGFHGRALQFWRDISLSEEGPSYNSLIIALKATEKQPFGYRMANAIWRQLQESDVEINPILLSSYAAALAGNGHVEDALKIVQQCEKLTGEKPDPIMLGTLYNAANGANKQEQIEAFIRDRFPGVFEKFEAEHGIAIVGLGKSEVQDIMVRLRP